MRKTGIVAAGMVLALTVVGCGSKEAGIPLAVGASGNTSSAPSGGSGGGKKDFGSATDLADAVNSKSDANKSAKMTFTTGVAGQSFKGEGAFNADGDNSSMRMTMDVASMKMEIVLVDKVIYVKMPPGAGGSGSADKPWTKVTPGGSDPMSKQMGPMLENIDDSFDIGMQIDRIKSAGTINKTTKEQLAGEDVTHYDITIDTAKLEQNAPTPEAKQSAKALSSIGVKTFDMDWWLNSDNLPVKVTSTIPGPNNMKVETEATYKDWGQPVDIKAPPADQIAN